MRSLPQFSQFFRVSLAKALIPLWIGACITISLPVIATASDYGDKESIVLSPSRSSSSKRLELRAKETRTLSFTEPLVRTETSHPEIIEVSQPDPQSLQLFGKEPGLGYVRIFDNQNRTRTLEVVVIPSTVELEFVLGAQFPQANLKVTPYSGGVMLSGDVQAEEHVDQIVAIAEDFYPRVLQNIKLRNPRQVLLHVRVMEVSRTKLRALGFDLRCGIVGDGVGGHGFLDTLREHDLAKVLAEPTLVAISGRSASFRAGGEFPVLVAGAMGTNSIEYKPYGMEIDFVPRVLEDQRVRLEIRPRISEIDTQAKTKLGKHRVPSLNVRQVDTGVEMRAGQTFALAGLIQNRVQAERRGVPFLADIPYLGMPFRHVASRENEIELLITVTPQLVEPIDPHQVCSSGPGLNSTTSSSKALFCRGHLETPYRCAGPIETVTPNTAYDAFLPEVNAHEVVDPNPFPQPTPLAPESLPLGTGQTNDPSTPWSIGISGENLPLHSNDGLIGPVGYETE
ncbi:MAG: pilus assembly protein N-terminal domain-containing protein [Planctomycetota bacterium]|nr:pilus assembly protein N-terminal domain-containing protein [Planctomycetota bacterium]